MKRKIIFLSILWLFLAASARDSNTFTYEGIKYTVLSEEEKTVKTAEGFPMSHDYQAGNSVRGELSLPSKVVYNGDSYTLVEISDFGFYQSQITSLTLPETITKIGRWAFADNAPLESADLSKLSLEILPENIFNNCISLTKVQWPKNIMEFDTGVFSGCNSLGVFEIPETVIKIGDKAFYNCKNLFFIIIPKATTSIGLQAFSRCPNLSTISIPEDNPAYYADKGMLFNKSKTKLICYPSAVNDIVVPDGVTTIESYAFEYCNEITSVTLPGTLYILGRNAFSYCYYILWVKCLAVNPPTVEGGVESIAGPPAEFVPLYIPEQSLELYKSTAPWNSMIVLPITDSGVETVIASETGEYIVFTLEGRKVMQTTNPTAVNSLPKGLYIVNGKKILIK